MFERADLNDDGVIDRQEFAQAVRQLFKNRRGEGRRGDDRRGEDRRSEGRRDWQCPKNPQGECFGGLPARENRFDGPRGNFGPPDRRGEGRFGTQRGPMMDRGREGKRGGMGDGFHRDIERMIKDAVAEALHEAHAGPPMRARDRDAKGKERGAAGKGRGPDRPMLRDRDFGMMKPAQRDKKVQQRDGDGPRGAPGERGPHGDRAERFQKLDRNGDGVITLDEFNAVPKRDGADKAAGEEPRGEKKRQNDKQQRRGGRGPGERGPRA